MPEAPFRRRALSMTSLIDVIFLLLLFFMLSTTFTRTGDLVLASAGTGGAGPGEPPVFLRLETADLTVNATAAGLDDLAARLAELGGDQPQVLVSLGDGVSAQRLADLLLVLSRVPGARVQVLG
jgi:biopolymer transport protein ExbD